MRCVGIYMHSVRSGTPTVDRTEPRPLASAGDRGHLLERCRTFFFLPDLHLQSTLARPCSTGPNHHIHASQLFTHTTPARPCADHGEELGRSRGHTSCAIPLRDTASATLCHSRRGRRVSWFQHDGGWSTRAGRCAQGICESITRDCMRIHLGF